MNIFFNYSFCKSLNLCLFPLFHGSSLLFKYRYFPPKLKLDMGLYQSDVLLKHYWF
jgi:hypothetical protein